MPPRIGLALSGGGFRATLFHLGVIRLLNEAGLLSQVKRIGAVSGGSILAAHLVLHWTKYAGSSEEFDKAAQEIIQFVQKDIRGRIVRMRILAWLCLAIPRLFMRSLRGWTFTNLLQKHYGRLYKNKVLRNLRGPERPQVYFYSTSLTTGWVCSFGRSGFRWHEEPDSPLEKSIAAPNTSIAFAVAASSAFPPLFAPIEISNETLFCDKRMFPYSHYLTDGGIYDNLGIERLRWYQKTNPELDLFIASDAQGNFDSALDTRFTAVVGRNVRASDLMMTRVSSMQIERLTGPGQAPPFVRVGIQKVIEDPGDPTVLSPENQRSLPNVRTDLDQFAPVEITALIAHGYSCARKTLIDAKLLTESAPRFSWDPLRNWQMMQTANVLGQLRQSSIRRWRVWSFRDWASYALLGLVLVPLVGGAYWAWSFFQRKVDQETRAAAQEIAVAASTPRILKDISDRNVTIPFAGTGIDQLGSNINVAVRINVTFRNMDPRAAVLDWIDPEGSPKKITIIQPGEYVIVETFAGHLWSAKTESGESMGTYLVSLR